MTATDALVGHTGFVGGNLARRHAFTDSYSSANVGELAGRRFERVYFSAAKAEKWRANADPEADAAHIAELKEVLRSFEAGQLVLISTVDVYRNPVGVDEDTPLPEPGLHAYGAHRLELESFAREQFDSVLVVRLPGLFGPGIKKNVVFDFLHDNNLDRIDSRGVFQYYNLERLWEDLETALAAGLELVNFATEPVSTATLVAEAFQTRFDQELAGVTPGRYDFRTRHAEVFGGSDGYLYRRDQVLADLRAFVAAERGAGSQEATA